MVASRKTRYSRVCKALPHHFERLRKVRELRAKLLVEVRSMDPHAFEEAQLATLREELKQDPGGDWAKVATMAKEEQALAARVEQLLEEWAALAEELA